jgi:hypothetical protein
VNNLSAAAYDGNATYIALAEQFANSLVAALVLEDRVLSRIASALQTL